MTYKTQMHPTVSNAEIEVFKALSAQGLTGGMVTQQQIILKSTLPDFCWMQKRKAVYLDGDAVHRKDKQLEHDEEIDNLLTKQGWQVLRLRYHAPLTHTAKMDILRQIAEFIGGIN